MEKELFGENMYHYNKGDTLGPLNITYIKEDVPYIRPDGRKKTMMQ